MYLSYKGFFFITIFYAFYKKADDIESYRFIEKTIGFSQIIKKNCNSHSLVLFVFTLSSGIASGLFL